MGSVAILTLMFMAVGSQLPIKVVSQKLQPVLLIDILECAPRFARSPLESCIGGQCRPCEGTCKRRCGRGETLASGYCGGRCQCCKRAIITLPPSGPFCGGEACTHSSGSLGICTNVKECDIDGPQAQPQSHRILPFPKPPTSCRGTCCICCPQKRPPCTKSCCTCCSGMNEVCKGHCCTCCQQKG